MAWLEAHQELRDHPKIKRAARVLGISRPQMIGHMLCLWWWCLDYAEDGDLSDFDNADIADAAAWDGDPDIFINALVDCGPADRPGLLVSTSEGVTVNDWEEYGGKYITKRNQGRDRQRTYRQRNAEVTRDKSVSNTPREEKRKEEDITGQERKEENSREDDAMAAAVAAWHAGGLTVTKAIADDLRELIGYWEAKGYPWYVADAITEATRQGKLTLAYVQGILRGCERENRAPSNKARRNGTDPSPFPSPVKNGKLRMICEDGSIEEVEAMTNG